MKVAELFASFAIRPDFKSLSKAHAGIRSLRTSMFALGGLAAAGGLVKSMIGFNSRVEDAKNNIAAMLGLAKKTSMTSELATASQLYDDIRKKAAELPGTTEDYVQAMAKLTLPIVSAGGSMEDLKDLTVSTIVAAKGGVGGATVKTAITDVLQGIEGRFSTTDFFLKAILEPLGFEGKDGRERFKALSKKQRFQKLQEGLRNPVFRELAEKQSQSWTGQMDKMKEATAQFLGRVGLPLFKALTKALTAANAWLGKNKDKVEAFADTFGKVIVTVFGAVGKVFTFLAEHGEFTKSLFMALAVVASFFAGKMVFAWLAFAAPIMLVVGRITLLIYLFQKLKDKIGVVGAFVVTAFGAVLMMKFRGITTQIWAMARAMLGFGAATRAAGAAAGATAASSAINGMGGLALGPAGRAGATATGAGAAAGAAGAGAGAAAGGMGLLSAISLPFLAAMAVDSFIPRDEKIDSVLGNWDAMKAMTTGGELGKLGAPINNSSTVINAPLTLNITGVKDADEAVAALREEHDKQMRHLQVATAGGRR